MSSSPLLEKTVMEEIENISINTIDDDEFIDKCMALIGNEGRNFEGLEEEGKEEEIGSLEEEVGRRSLEDEDEDEDEGLEEIRRRNLEEEEVRRRKEVLHICENFLIERKKMRHLVEEKNKSMSQVEAWHEEKRIENNKKQSDKTERDLRKQIAKTVEEVSREKRELEFKEYEYQIKDGLGEENYKNILPYLVFDKNGNLNPKRPMNYDLLVQHDLYIQKHFRNNVLANTIEFDGNNITNKDLTNLISYFDRVYGIADEQKIYNALIRPGNITQYHPIKDLIEEKEWDGKERIDNFFKKVCSIDTSAETDNIYYRECARMLFYGGIRRLYEPGSKFDYMLIFEGKQGSGKSTLVRLLALCDKAYSEITTIDGKEGIEAIQGTWIVEFAELLAMVKTREVEQVKAFITRQYDKYRPAYARMTETVPRTTIFIGTTNDATFLKDATGNRRYLPIAINTDVRKMFANIDKVKKYILECWREAYHKYKKGEAYFTIDSKCEHILEKIRSKYTEENPIDGLIMSYCHDKEIGDEVSNMEIYVKCFNGLKKNFSNVDSKNITRVMKSLPNWERMQERKYFPEYGRQRYWKKIYKDEEIEERMMVVNDEDYDVNDYLND